jgi:adenine-specific DNA-methyltransferase
MSGRMDACPQKRAKKSKREVDVWAYISAPPPSPFENERPTNYADRIGVWYVAQKSPSYRKSQGLYLTPVPVAGFLAQQVPLDRRSIRILDPAAGLGALACAAVEEVVAKSKKTKRIDLVVYEIDRAMADPLRSVLAYLTEWCRSISQIALRVEIHIADFLAARSDALSVLGNAASRLGCHQEFDVVISNPPYFKLSKRDPRALDASVIVHGQPNIYALFMAAGAVLLKPNGYFIFIVPRSFASGAYFRKFRSVFFDIVRPRMLHVFGSRRDAFCRDAVLQENVVIAGVRDDYWAAGDSHEGLLLSHSHGVDDLVRSGHRTIPLTVGLALENTDRILRLPLTEEEHRALELVTSWRENLERLGLKVSTGPVIPFRAASRLAKQGDVSSTHCPLLWMAHVSPLLIRWPIRRHKPEYIQRDAPKSLLVANRNYVLLRRFSPKEDPRRLVAAPFLARDFDASEIGLENHLNYVHCPEGPLGEDEAWGLAALFNSRLLDTYFRVISGNTQVSATELRSMPLPSMSLIIELGRQMKSQCNPIAVLDETVAQLLETKERVASPFVELGRSPKPIAPAPQLGPVMHGA